MYDLGSEFKIDLNKAKANPECVFKGKKYRITVLTERLVRLEYSENGFFVDEPTQRVLYRNLPKPNFISKETDDTLTIVTKYFELVYKKEKKFKSNSLTPMVNLKISLLNTDRVWYYGHPEARNYDSISHKLTDKKKLKGLYSLDGFATIDDSSTNIFKENGSLKKRENKSIDIYVFLYNKDFYFCLNDYFAITGNPPLIPRIALGNWWCKNDFYDDEQIYKLVNKFESEKVPISIFMINNWQQPDSYIFNQNLKDPKAISDFLFSKKIKPALLIKDQHEFKNNTIIFERLKKYLPTDTNGNIPFNIYDEKTIDAYLKLIITPLNNTGFNTFFLGDYEKNNENRNFSLKHYLYTTKHNGIHLRNLICSYNSLIAPHRYSVLYTGRTKIDWSTFKKILQSNILASNMGISFLSHDLGGSIDDIEDNELFVRFVQLSVFSPIFRLGSVGGKYNKRVPWKWDLATSIIAKEFMNLRYKLIPYIYTECYKYHKYGKPLIEPLYLRYPMLYDDDLYSSEYFFGSNILVCPILNKKDPVMNRVIHKIYLPEGVWYDIFTGKRYNGGRRYATFYKDNEYPLFVRAGTIIPVAENVFNDTAIPKKLGIEIFPGANGTYSIYEDDGVTKDYKNGEYLITNVEFMSKQNSYSLTILPVKGKQGIVYEARDYKIKFRNTKVPNVVKSYVGNQIIPNKFYKENDDLVVEVENIKTNSQLTIICNIENIEVDALSIINEDIVSIISDLPIKTIVKQKIDEIMFSKTLSIKKKRIEIRKLANGKNWIERKYIDLFLKLLEYIQEV